MNILIYEKNLNGHRLEYLHHLYMLALDMPRENFYFVLSDRFSCVKDMFVWPMATNVIIELVSSEDVQPNGRPGIITLFKNQKKQARVLRSLISKYKIDRIFEISILNYFPFVPLFLKKGVIIDGIQYSLFPWAHKNFVLRKLDYLKYYFYKAFSCFGNIYTLNERLGAEKLNKTLHTTKFSYLPDPFSPISTDPHIDFRKEYGIGNAKIVFVHFGGLQSRKGTLHILNSIRLLNEEERERYVFVFAGRVYDEIKESFYQAYYELRDSANIIVKDEFCDYGFLASLCSGCDAILMPYLVTTQSSGLVGYASQFRKPVIAPSKDIIGRIVRDYKLGYLMPSVNPENLVAAYKQIAEGAVESPTNDYCLENSVFHFQEVIKCGLSKEKYD